MLEHYGFDGWLINIEAPLPGGVADYATLTKFLRQLRTACRERCAMAKVLIYDSLTAVGRIACEWMLPLPLPLCLLTHSYAWLTQKKDADYSHTYGGTADANALTQQENKPLFDACDGIFLNYWWNPSKAQTPEWLRASRLLAGEARRGDVYAGVRLSTTRIR